MGFDSEDEVAASSYPKAWAPTPLTLGRRLRLIQSHGEGSASTDPQGLDFISPSRQGEISTSPVPWGRICYQAKAVALGWDSNRFNHYSVETHAREHVSGVS